MDTQRYEIYLTLECWNIFHEMSTANKWNIFQHGKKHFVSSSDHVIFFFLYNMLTIHNDVFGDFPMISEDSPKFVHRRDKHFWTFSDKLPKNIQRGFSHTPTNLTAVEGTKMLSKIISSCVDKNDIFSCGISFINFA